MDKNYIAVMDGSYDPDSKLATAFWYIEGKTSENRAKSVSQTPEDVKDKDAYQA